MNTSRIQDLLFVLAVAILWLVPLSVANAQTPKSPELKVLDRLVGSWRLEEVERQANGDEKKNTAILITKWSLQGRYIEVRGTESDGKKQNSLNLWTYDSDAGVYKMWMFVWNNPNTIPVTWRWNESKKTFTGKGAGNTMQMTIRFIDNDRYEYTATAKDASGNVVVETKGKVFRKK